MELKEYLNILKKNILIVVILVAGGTLIGVIMARAMPYGYQGSQTYILRSFAIPAQQDSNFEYYNQERARNFTDTAVAILESPNFKREEVQISGGNITVKKLAPQIIRVTAFSNRSDYVSPLLSRTIERFNSKLVTFGVDKMNIEQIGQEDEPQLSKLNTKVTAMAGATAGFAAAILALSLKTYFRI